MPMLAVVPCVGRRVIEVRRRDDDHVALDIFLRGPNKRLATLVLTPTDARWLVACVTRAVETPGAGSLARAWFWVRGVWRWLISRF